MYIRSQGEMQYHRIVQGEYGAYLKSETVEKAEFNQDAFSEAMLAEAVSLENRQDSIKTWDNSPIILKETEQGHLRGRKHLPGYFNESGICWDKIESSLIPGSDEDPIDGNSILQVSMDAVLLNKARIEMGFRATFTGEELLRNLDQLNGIARAGQERISIAFSNTVSDFLNAGEAEGDFSRAAYRNHIQKTLESQATILSGMVREGGRNFEALKNEYLSQAAVPADSSSGKLEEMSYGQIKILGQTIHEFTLELNSTNRRKSQDVFGLSLGMAKARVDMAVRYGGLGAGPSALLKAGAAHAIDQEIQKVLSERKQRAKAYDAAQAEMSPMKAEDVKKRLYGIADALNKGADEFRKTLLKQTEALKTAFVNLSSDYADISGYLNPERVLTEESRKIIGDRMKSQRVDSFDRDRELIFHNWNEFMSRVDIPERNQYMLPTTACQIVDIQI